MNSKEQREYLKTTIKERYSTHELSDLYNDDFRNTFLADHLAEVVPATIDDIQHGLSSDSLTWPYGCMYTGRKGKPASYYAAFFIFLWHYGHLTVSDADMVASKLSYFEELHLTNRL